MSAIRPEVTGRSSGVEFQRIIGLKEASRLSGLSVDSIKRHHRDKILKLSPRRRGMRIRDALMLANKEED